MGKYDSRLSNLTSADVFSRLEGQGGLLALSSRELFFLNDHSEQSARLASIKRIGVNKTSGNVDVMGDQGTLLEIPPTAFQKDELKLFLESLKGHVLRAKTNPTLVEPENALTATMTPSTPATTSAGLPPRMAEPEPTLVPEPEPFVPVRDPEPEPPVIRAEPTPVRFPTPIPDHFETPALTEPINIAEPPKTLPDDPDSIWAYEGQAKPVTATQEMPPVGRPSTDSKISQDVVPPAMNSVPVPMPLSVQPSSTQRTGFFLLKISAILTGLFAVLFFGINFFMPSPGASVDPLSLVGVLVGGVALTLIQWRLSEPL
ncbi:MAG: hypothetical protein SFU83_07805 [Meiothermus sp.]|nr:hypothetical protein [Meiothermus sp.]